MPPAKPIAKKSKTSPLSRIIGLLIIMLVVGLLVFKKELQLRYTLWLYHAKPETLSLEAPPLCKEGSGVQPRLIQTLHEHGHVPEAQTFRALVVQTIRCWRLGVILYAVKQVSPEDTPYADLGAFSEAALAVKEAIEAEPRADARKQLVGRVALLDFNFRFALWAALATSAKNPPDGFGRLGIPDPFKHFKAGLPVPIAKAWCEMVAPVIRQIVRGDGLYASGFAPFENAPIVKLLSALKCQEDDPALVKEYLANQ